MAEETRITYVPLKGASLDIRGTKANSPDLPVLVAMDNLYSSPSTQLPTMRGALVKTADLFSVVNAENDPDWINSIVAQNNPYSQTFIARLAPMAYGDSLEGSLRCLKYSCSLDNEAGENVVARVSGPQFIPNVFPGDFIKFSDDALYYTIKSVSSNDFLETVSNITGAHSSDSATIYHTHCSSRARWPVSYDKFGDVHIYLPVDPTGSSPIESMRSPFTRKSDSELDMLTTISTTVSGVPSTYTYYSVDSLNANYTPKFNWILKGASDSELFASVLVGYPGQGYFSTYKSVNGGISWIANEIRTLGGFGCNGKVFYDSANARIGYTGNAGGGGSTGGGRYFHTGANVVNVSNKDVYPLWLQNCSPVLNTIITDSTNYLTFGYETIGLTRVAVCYSVAIAGLVVDSTGWNIDENRLVLHEMLGTGINDAVWDGATVIAVGESGSIQTSSDLSAWTETNGGNNTYRLFSVANNGTSGYVSVGSAGTIVYSSDAVTWSSATSGTTEALYNVIYADSLWVVVGCNGTILTSPDMSTWTVETSGTTGNLSSVTYDGVNFVAVSSDTNIVLLSADGHTWADTIGLSPGPVVDLVSDGISTSPVGVTRDSGVGVYSVNGSRFTYGEWPTLLTQSNASAIAWGGSFYVSVGEGGVIATSTDGVLWTTQTSGVAKDLFGVCWDATNSKWIAVGDQMIVSSADAITWSDDSASIPATLTGVIFSRVRYIPTTATVVAIGVDSTAGAVTAYSTDATAWTHALCRNSGAASYYDISYNVSESDYMWVGTTGSQGFLNYSTTLDYPTLNVNSGSIASLTLTGMTHANSEFGKLYAKWTHPISPLTDGTFELFSDSVMTTLVADGTGPVDSDITLTASGGSGLSGTVKVEAAVVADFTAEPTTEYTGIDITGITNSTNIITGISCDSSYIVISGKGGSCGIMKSDYTDVTKLAVVIRDYECVNILSDGSFWLGFDKGFLKIIAGIADVTSVTNTEYIYWANLPGGGCNCFMILDGYVIKCGTREFESGAWVYHPRRLVWSVPGTYSDFTGFGSGTQDVPGFGDFLACEKLEHAGIIFEKAGIGVITSTGNYDPELGPIWEYRQIKQGLTTISNVVKQEGQIFFIGNTGLLYSTNGVEVQELGSSFDLSKFTEFPPTTPVQMVFSPAARQLQIHQQSSGEDGSDIPVTVYLVNIDSGACSTWSTTSPGNRFSLVQIIGAGEPAWP